MLAEMDSELFCARLKEIRKQRKLTQQELAEKSGIPLKAQTEKMTLALTLPDNLPGALYKALSTFAWRGIDLTKIESRPLKTALGEYFFIIDVDYADKDLVHFAQKELEAIGIQYKVLGAYPIYPISDHGKERR